MKDSTTAHVILGIKTIKESNKYILSQSYCIEQIVDIFDKKNNDITGTLVDINLHLIKNNGANTSKVEYSLIVGIIMYQIKCIQQDITYSVSKLSRYTINPRENY